MLNSSSGGDSTVQVSGQGDTQVENTVIRWFIDSEPRGARMFWQVVSSHADINNTNESYLGVTTFEETRTLYIRWLSGANAGNVQIEVRLQ